MDIKLISAPTRNAATKHKLNMALHIRNARTMSSSLYRCRLSAALSHAVSLPHARCCNRGYCCNRFWVFSGAVLTLRTCRSPDRHIIPNACVSLVVSPRFLNFPLNTKIPFLFPIILSQSNLAREKITLGFPTVPPRKIKRKKTETFEARLSHWSRGNGCVLQSSVKSWLLCTYFPRLYYNRTLPINCLGVFCLCFLYVHAHFV